MTTTAEIQRTGEPRHIDIETVRRELEIRAQHIDEKIARLERAMLVSAETMLLELRA